MSTSTESNIGNRKEEILAKSRQARKDEGVEYAELRGYKFAANIAFIAAGLPMIIYSILFSEVIVVLATVIFIEAYYAGLHAMAYRLSKKPKYIFWAAMCAVIFIVCSSMFVRTAMGLSVFPGLGVV